MSNTGEIIFYGASDDLVEFEGIVYDEFDACGPWEGILEAPDGSWMKLAAEFCKPGATQDWTVEITEQSPGNEWLVVEGERPDYDRDPALYITAPVGTTVREL